ncbi:YiiX/YebB-like N1pC/P60 family cysteine hydrolase [Polynucleobacter sp. SHI8]|uniref:YiiX/YebB-like N1pC/P60 family cysteine hydrolase n=1 Tax=Polynucleobacter sp. SHI8 TaxID=926418 RepID=UPI0024926D3B|nr:YiiX/YebB-like N1pC/P60 family cysteine hydrolase [Polynucleobacter sp. SHI8]
MSLAIAGLYFFQISHHVPEKNKYALYDQLSQKKIKEGQLIFIAKPGFWGDIAQAFSEKDKRFAHVGLIAKTINGEITVINADGNPIDPKGSVREEPLKNFMASATSISIYDLKLENKTINQIIDRARYYVDQRYEFNSQFILGQSNSLYCTELLWVSIKDVTQRDIVPNKRTHWGYEYIGIDDLTTNPLTQEVIQLNLSRISHGFSDDD